MKLRSLGEGKMVFEGDLKVLINKCQSFWLIEAETGNFMEVL